MLNTSFLKFEVAVLGLFAFHCNSFWIIELFSVSCSEHFEFVPCIQVPCTQVPCTQVPCTQVPCIRTYHLYFGLFFLLCRYAFKRRRRSRKGVRDTNWVDEIIEIWIEKWHNHSRLFMFETRVFHLTGYSSKYKVAFQTSCHMLFMHWVVFLKYFNWFEPTKPNQCKCFKKQKIVQ